WTEAWHRHRVHRWRSGWCDAAGGCVMSGMVWKVLQHRNTAMGPAGGDWMRLTHWRWAKDEEGIAWLIFDRAGESANTLSVEALAELDKALGEIHAEGARALVIRSAK